jgi:homoserine/homoserine lactone efflux protein
MSASSLGLFFIVVFITCVTPGAGVLYTLKNAINYGKNNAFLSPTGNAIGVLFMSILAASGLGAVIHESPVMFYGLQLCGCLLLFWFGWWRRLDRC